MLCSPVLKWLKCCGSKHCRLTIKSYINHGCALFQQSEVYEIMVANIHIKIDWNCCLNWEAIQCECVFLANINLFDADVTVLDW